MRRIPKISRDDKVSTERAGAKKLNSGQRAENLLSISNYFKFHDLKDDGVIDKEELLSYFKSDKTVAAIIERIDKNRDGVISYAEFFREVSKIKDGEATLQKYLEKFPLESITPPMPLLMDDYLKDGMQKEEGDSLRIQAEAKSQTTNSPPSSILPLPPSAIATPTLPWHVSLSAAITENTLVFPAQSNDISRVVSWYQRSPVPGFEIKSIKVAHNPQIARMFAGRVDLLERRYGKPQFEPKWKTESHNSSALARRKQVMDLFVSLCSPHHCESFPHVSLIPQWHGTSPSALQTILSTGFANLATTDEGYFGKGIYNTSEAEYAHRVYSQGTLLINWVAVASPFPVIFEDVDLLMGKGSYQNYDAHFAPVFSPSHPDSVYFPCKHGETHQYTEIVVFESSQVLPRFIVELNPPINNNTNNNVNIKKPVEWTVEEVCVWLKTLALSKDYSTVFQDNNICGSVLLSMTKDDWKEVGVTVFGDVRLLTTGVNLRLKTL